MLSDFNKSSIKLSSEKIMSFFISRAFAAAATDFNSNDSPSRRRQNSWSPSKKMGIIAIIIILTAETQRALQFSYFLLSADPGFAFHRAGMAEREHYRLLVSSAHRW